MALPYLEHDNHTVSVLQQKGLLMMERQCILLRDWDVLLTDRGNSSREAYSTIFFPILIKGVNLWQENFQCTYDSWHQTEERPSDRKSSLLYRQDRTVCRLQCQYYDNHSVNVATKSTANEEYWCTLLEDWGIFSKTEGLLQRPIHHIFLPCTKSQTWMSWRQSFNVPMTPDIRHRKKKPSGRIAWRYFVTKIKEINVAHGTKTPP